MKYRRREKVFGPGRAVPLDRNAKARIEAYARAWSRRNRTGRQHPPGPLTRTCQDVLNALLWKFHNSKTGTCFPSYERIAELAECSRDTVYEALQVLELAGVLTWQNRITRIRERYCDLFGRYTWRTRVIRTSNAYVFRDPLHAPVGLPASKSENPTGTQNQEASSSFTGKRRMHRHEEEAREGATVASLKRSAARTALEAIAARRMTALGLVG